MTGQVFLGHEVMDRHMVLYQLHLNYVTCVGLCHQEQSRLTSVCNVSFEFPVFYPADVRLMLYIPLMQYADSGMSSLCVIILTQV